MRNLTLANLALLALLNSSALPAAQSSAVGLMYHHFGVEKYPSTNIRLEQFEQHLDYLADSDFKVLPLMTVLDALQTGETLPDKTVVITMDDAYDSIYSQAYPRLKKRGWPFTVFVSTDYIDKGFSNYMSWQQMREMQQHGASFGNHSRSHDHLIRRLPGETEAQWRRRVTDDIRSAQQRLDDELDAVIDVIAYPYGEYNLALAQMVASLGMVGMGQHSGAMGVTSDFRFLPRFPMAEDFGDPDEFATKVSSLAMPLQQTPPVNPVTDAARPTLTLSFERQHAPLTQLSCFASGQGRIEVKWVREYQAQIRADKDLPAGRSRYNCTAPAGESGRFYWFSQPWIRPGGTD
ncbi:hypothetical protein Tel_04255 [Candidatus Tenderia electrophaga]|jgi:peptidoglycan/xylan/chitin deacetylase (PgdA/CDA1 family)|uniref:NodB homology domain-containing protein n=1 Tax=Candidatus Tenderia electrophaga TaxID=1748243 RepID=A0A0S2TB83_9GAMM|nr:hypothetical protein Tel_04255 [Candidatus Tenderia electrophaga]